MIMQLKVMIGLLALMFSPTAIRDCESGCQTEIVVTDCQGAAVANARIEVKLCCNNNEQVDVSTNASGVAVVNHCLKDLCGTRIVLEGFTTLAIDRNGCSNDGKNSRCEIKMCKR
jgi:hypothetical protein